MSTPTANVILNTANDFTHPQARVVDNPYRSSDSEFYIQTVDSGLLVPERTFRWGSWYRADFTTAMPSGTVIIWHPNFGGTASRFTWDETTVESPEFHQSDPEYAFLGQDLGPISDSVVIYTPSGGGDEGGEGEGGRDIQRLHLLGYI